MAVARRTPCRSLILAPLAVSLCAAPASGGTTQQPPAGQTSPAVVERRLPLHRFQWSRQAQQDREGYYQQAVALCDDYPEESRTEEKVRRDFEAMQGTGVSLLRCGIAWESIERQPGQYDWRFWDLLVALAEKYHVTLIPYVCYTPNWLAEQPENFWRQPPRDVQKFADFVFAIASRYRGKIHSWELWNEPDNPEFWQGTPEQFAEMIKQGAAAVRRADPEALVVLGGMAATSPTPFFRTLKLRFDIESYVDVVNTHGYLETWNGTPMESYPGQITAMAVEVALSTPADTPDLWLAEFGYSNYRYSPRLVTRWGVRAYYKYEHTPEYQAIALFKAHILALTTGKLALTAWYRINDLQPAQTVIGDDNNKFLGILSLSGKPKPAYYALRFYNQLFSRPVRCLDREVRTRKLARYPVEVHCFEAKNGNVIVAAWLRSPSPAEIADDSGQAQDRRHDTLDLVLPQRAAHVTCYRENGEIEAGGARVQGNQLKHIMLTGGRIFIAEVSPPPLHGAHALR
jgi:hypothetical protein